MSIAKNLVIHFYSQTYHRFIPPEPGFSRTLLPPTDRELEHAVDWLGDRLSERQIRGLSASPGAVFGRLSQQIIQYLQFAKHCGARLVTFGEPCYPPLLREIPDPPAALCVLGNEAILQSPAMAVVGARKANLDSLKTSEMTGTRLAEAGYLVVSGGAYGCDIASHRGVLASRSPTDGNGCVVFAGGLGRRYPSHHERVFAELIERGGVLVSEKLWDHAPRRYDFPIRNRIVAGMCQGVIVVQAAVASGTIVTARAALDQGRDVFVCRPRFPEDVRFAGNTSLLADGAPPWSSLG